MAVSGRPRSCNAHAQRAVAGADFDNGSIGAIDGLHNGSNDAAIVKEVLAKLMPP